MSHKKTLKVQRKIQRVERDLAWIVKQSKRHGAHKTFQITEGVMTCLGTMAQNCLDGANALHGEMNRAAASSLNDDIIVIAGPNKDDN